LVASMQDIDRSIDSKFEERERGPKQLTRGGGSDSIARCECLDLSLSLRNRIAGEQCHGLSSCYVRGISGS
jgi:hypothetical protein